MSDRRGADSRQEALYRRFPSLVEGSNYSITSPATADYNCFAWALGLDNAWFSPEPSVGGYYWPIEVPMERSLISIRLIFSQYGYLTETVERSFEPGWEKVAFYGDIHGAPQHCSRQLPSGAWTSKIGRLHDIEHQNLESFEGFESYGPVILILKRKTQ